MLKEKIVSLGQHTLINGRKVPNVISYILQNTSFTTALNHGNRRYKYSLIRISLEV